MTDQTAPLTDRELIEHLKECRSNPHENAIRGMRDGERYVGRR